MRLLVTGAGGILGSAFARWASTPPHDLIHPPEVHAFPRASLDIADAARVAASLDRIKPEAVINCAAFTNVDAAERETWACRRANVEGPRVLAEACAARRCRLVHVSTDYVFDGEKGSPYVETDPPAPRGVYAMSKREGEVAVLEACPEAVVARSSWIFGQSGKQDFVDWVIRGLRSGGLVRVIADQRGGPSWSEDVARALVHLCTQPAGIYHASNAGSCSRAEQAHAIAAAAGLEHRFEEVPASALKRLAPRPRNTPLDSGRIAASGHPMRPWDVALREYVQGRADG
ncbi:MAG: dTDP-4-dehydrorhamnose reductase [Planctomycetes bacterium]|nr:dTDP-4-dehydrorhamnose reductase [Planctomycetota bacterium]